MRGIPAFEYYSGSKFALEGIMDSLRYSLFGYGIAITNVNAGPVKSAFTKNVMKNKVEHEDRKHVDSTGYLEYLTKRMFSLLEARIDADGITVIIYYIIIV